MGKSHYDDLTDAALIAQATKPLRPRQWEGLAVALAERLEMAHRELYELERAYTEARVTHDLILDAQRA